MKRRYTGHTIGRGTRRSVTVTVRCPQCDQELKTVKESMHLPMGCPDCRIVFDPKDGTVIRRMEGHHE